MFYKGDGGDVCVVCGERFRPYNDWWTWDRTGPNVGCKSYRHAASPDGPVDPCEEEYARRMRSGAEIRQQRRGSSSTLFSPTETPVRSDIRAAAVMGDVQAAVADLIAGGRTVHISIRAEPAAQAGAQ